MPYGNMPSNGCCPTCGSSMGQTQGFAGQGMPAGAPSMGCGPGMGMGFGAAGMGPGAMMPQTGFMNPWNTAWMNPIGLGWGLGGGRRWGGTYTPQFQMTGLPTDNEITEMVYDAIDADPLIPYDADIDVESDAGSVTLTGTVATKEIKHAAGDDAWWMPGVDDVHNELKVERHRPSSSSSGQSSRRRSQNNER